MYRVQIGGSLMCDGGSFKNSGKRALYADGAKIGRAIRLRNGFVAEGEVTLYGAETRGNLNCNRGSFKNAGKRALNATLANIGGSVLFRDAAHAEGDLQLYGTRIGADLDLSGANFAAETPVRLRIVGADIKGALKIHSLTKSPKTEMQISDTSCAVLDDRLEAWRDLGRLDLDGFAYRRIRDPDKATFRVDWLRLQLPVDKAECHGSFRPQPYRQLAQVLRAQGHETESREILVGMAEDRRKYGRLGGWSWFWTWVLWHVMRNGYKPLRAFFWLLLLWVANGLVFYGGYHAGLMGPTDQKAFEAVITNHGVVPDWYPRFRAVSYAIDVSLPIISLGERDKWRPLDRPVDPKSILPAWVPDAFAIWLPDALVFYRWIAIAAGWFLASMLLAGVTGLVAKE